MAPVGVEQWRSVRTYELDEAGAAEKRATGSKGEFPADLAQIASSSRREQGIFRGPNCGWCQRAYYIM
jgi:hypothetical protein